MKERLIRLVLGKRGSGKSFYVKQESLKANRVLIYDTIGEYSGYGVTVSDLDELIEYWLKIHDKNFRIVYQPLRPAQEFDDVCDLVYACGDMVFIAEEIDIFTTNYDLSESFANIIQRGRHRNIDFFGVSQRPYRINRTVSSQAKEIITFIQTEPRDLEYLRLYMGSDHIDKISNLPEYHYFKWTSGGVIEIGKKKGGGENGLSNTHNEKPDEGSFRGDGEAESGEGLGRRGTSGSENTSPLPDEELDQ